MRTQPMSGPRGPTAVLVAAVVAVALVVASATDARAAPATTWAELQPQLKGKDKSRKATTLLRFARDDAAALADRLKAVRAARPLLPAKDPRRVDAALVEAGLHGVAGARGKRRSALRAAESEAKRAGLEDKRARLEEARAGEDAAAELARLLARRERGEDSESLREQTTKVAARLEGALPAWLALGDERQHGAARVLLGRRLAADGDVPGAVRVLADVVDALGAAPAGRGASRDGAAVQADAWRLLARLYEAQGQWPDAVAAALAGDRAAAVNPRKPAPSSTPSSIPSSTAAALAEAPSPHVRSRETAALCNRARAAGVSCAKVELQRWGARTFYDFSTEKKGAFDPARANDVVAEYDSLLEDCLKQGAKANLTTNTHVELEWGVSNDGRVLKTFDLRPMRLRGTVVETCLARAFPVFRYPPYRGEMQHVRLSFDVGEVRGP